ncbi:pilus assembly protein [Shewanella corallii]|uniref:Pilus assembly protein n=1 Tax=Shewanella corallii TaxID=560080 RepID=A0ABT0N5Y0_9GAMM|nr:pilus assembly protein [Shewanella corallii]MCL2913857.1 pilus assembly protein [Shewanella corallii]
MKFKASLGQGMTEYIIIVALIAVSAIGVYSFFGKTLRNQTAGVTKEISGQNSETEIASSQTASGQASTVADKEYNLGNYNEGGNDASGDTVD